MFLNILKEDYNRLWITTAEHDEQLSCSVLNIDIF